MGGLVMSTPASRLQIELHEYQSEMQRFRDFEKMTDGTESLSPWNIAWFLMSDSEWVAENSYLAGDQATCTKWSRIAAESVVYYLFGDWKKKQKHDDGTIDPERCFRVQPSALNLTWARYLADGLCWGAAGGHWELIDRLLAFPEPTIQADDDGEVARDYYLGLARWWKDPQDIAWIKEVNELRGAGSKAYHLLCDAVAAIAIGEKRSLEKVLDQYVKLFIKRRTHDQQFPIAATFLWYVARRKGIRLELPEESAKYIFVPLEEL